jgi:hypothetical protein
VDRLKKTQCEKNLRKDVVAAAEDYGISITKAGGKKKTIKELCAELEVVVAQQPATTPPRTRTPSPVRGQGGVGQVGMPRPPTPPITDYVVPPGMVPKAVVYALTNIEIDGNFMPKADLLKPKVVSKPKLVLYAEELGIKGKSLSKEVLLDRIIAAQIAKDMPVIAQAIEDESSVIVDEIADRVSKRISASGEQPPDREEVQSVVEQRISTGESVSVAAVAGEIIAEQQSSRRSSSRSSTSRSASSSRSSTSRSASSSRSSTSRSASSSRSSTSRSNVANIVTSIKRQIRGERDIEALLVEIQKPAVSINNMHVIQNRVFRCLGIVN